MLPTATAAGAGVAVGSRGETGFGRAATGGGVVVGRGTRRDCTRRRSATFVAVGLEGPRVTAGLAGAAAATGTGDETATGRGATAWEGAPFCFGAGSVAVKRNSTALAATAAAASVTMAIPARMTRVRI